MQLAVTVIGRGIAGLSAAYRFSKAGFKVTVLGSGAEVGSASYAAVGVSSLKGERVSRSPLFSAKILGHKNLPSWIKEIELDSKTKIPNSFSGTIEPFNSEKEGEEIFERLSRDEFLEPFSPLKLNREEACTKLGGFSLPGKPISGAFFYINDGWVDVPSLLFSLETALKNFGVDFIEEKVLRFFTNTNGELETSLGEQNIRSNYLVLAAGYHSQEISEASGFSVLNMSSHPGQTLRVHLNEGVSIGGTKRKFSFLIQNGQLRFGATTFGKGTFSSDQRQLGFSQLKQDVKSVFGGFDLSTAEYDWGIRCRLADRLPAVGLLCPENKHVFVSTGLYKNGVQLADLAARFLVSQVSPEKKCAEVEEVFKSFNPQRFLS